MSFKAIALPITSVIKKFAKNVVNKIINYQF